MAYQELCVLTDVIQTVTEERLLQLRLIYSVLQSDCGAGFYYVLAEHRNNDRRRIGG